MSGPVVREQVQVATADDMRALGRRIAGHLRAGDLLILSGPLGAGKTTLVQGIGEGLNVRGPITSPTFVIARVHPPLGSTAATGELRPALVHADAYRLGSVLELDDLDLDTDAAASVTVVEWGGGLAEGLATDRLEITIAPAEADVPVVGDPLVEGTVDGGNVTDRAGDPDDPTVDVPRTVRISAVGERWEGIKLPLASLANRL